MSCSLDDETFGDALEFDPKGGGSQRTDKVIAVGRDGHTGTGVPYDRGLVFLANDLVGGSRSKEGGTNCSGGGEDSIRERGIHEVSLGNRGAQQIEVGGGESNGRRVAMLVGWAASTTIALTDALLAPWIVSLLANSPERDGSGKSTEAIKSVVDQVAIAVIKRETTVDFTAEAMMMAGDAFVVAGRLEVATRLADSGLLEVVTQGEERGCCGRWRA